MIDPALRERVYAMVREYLQVPEGEQLRMDADGDIPIRWGSALYYVRLLDKSPTLVQIFCVVLRNVASSHELLEEINIINEGIVSARMFWAESNVIAASELLADQLDQEELSHACWSVGSLADWADTELHEQFGGEMVFPDDAPEDKNAVPDWT
ncbi:MAG: YbjN domain-containing protein [Acidimicrobiia bacterium]|nr:YbjN domain-containing protein [Acidimicrobiia bacterium]